MLRLVGADGFRLSLCEEDIFDTENEDGGKDSTDLLEQQDFRFLVALKGMKEILSFLKDSKEDIFEIIFDGKRISMGNESHRLLVRLMDLEYPDYRRVIPNAFKTKVVVDREEFLKQLKFVHVITRTSGESIRLIIRSNQMQMLARAADRGEANIDLSVTKEGNDIQIAFNPRFVIEAVQHFKQPKLELNFYEESNPMQINEVDLPRLINVIMPVRMS
jgi:DNA polymerase-3 subunit beta